MHEVTNLLFREKLKGEKQYLEVNIEIKLADRSNFTDFSMDSFDRFQEVKNVYRIEIDNSGLVSGLYCR
jgi:hypothetical protein